MYCLQLLETKIVPIQQAIDHFRKTGEHLGAFKTLEDAETYSQDLHKQQEQMYEEQK